MTKEFNATKIGAIFTLVSFFSTFTFIVPMFFIIPVALMFENIIGPAPYSKIGTTAIIFLSIVTTLACLILFVSTFRLRRSGQDLTSGALIFFFVVITFIIHPLGFFLYVSTNWRMANDGQFIFAIFQPFAFTSFAYFIIGVTTDLIRNFGSNNLTPPVQTESITPKIHDQQKESSDNEELITVYFSHYRTKSNEELEHIIQNKGWQSEAKIAAQRTLNERKQ